MLRGLIAFCLLRRPLVLVAFAAFLGLGFAAFNTLNIEAYPDPAPPIVEIIAQRPGQSPEEMERYVTIPIEIAVSSTPGLRFIRSNTVYALSFIRLQFEYGRDYHFVCQQTVNRRGIGVVSSLEDIGNIVVTQQGGVPVLLSDVAKVQIGFTPRLGIAGRDGVTDIIFGVVMMQKLERTMEVVTRVRAAIERMNTDGTLPPGVKVDPFYDRGDLVAITVQTVLHNMFFGIALIFLIQWVFLGNLRCALIVSATIPVALLLAVIITVLRGESANLLSVGAIDLGIIVDATVIMLENIYRHLAHHAAHETADRGASMSDKLHRILTGAVEVDKAIFFSVIITIAAFLPLFTMQGVEGQIFGPMSRTYAYALLGAVIATFTVTPVMASVLLPARVNEVETFLVRQIRKVYDIVLPFAVRRFRVAAMIGLA